MVHHLISHGVHTPLSPNSTNSRLLRVALTLITWLPNYRISFLTQKNPKYKPVSWLSYIQSPTCSLATTRPYIIRIPFLDMVICHNHALVVIILTLLIVWAGLSKWHDLVFIYFYIHEYWHSVLPVVEMPRLCQNVLDFIQEFSSQMCTAGKFIDFLSGGRKLGQVGKNSSKKCLGFIKKSLFGRFSHNF